MSGERTPIEWMILPIKRYARFSGRAPRAEYWWFYLTTLVAGLIADLIDRTTGSEIGVLGLVINLGLVVPSIAVTVRRLHDTDRSGWWLLAPTIPAIVFGYQASQAALSGSLDTWVPAPSSLVSIFAFVLACVVMLVFMVLEGTRGPNRHGADPYGQDDQLEEIFA